MLDLRTPTGPARRNPSAAGVRHMPIAFSLCLWRARCGPSSHPRTAVCLNDCAHTPCPMFAAGWYRLPTAIVPIVAVMMVMMTVIVAVVAVARIDVRLSIAWVATETIVARFVIRIVSVEIIGRVFAVVVGVAPAPVRRFDN